MPAAQLLHRAIHNSSVRVVQPKGRQQEPLAPNAARLIGCRGRAAAAAAVVGYTTTTSYFLPFFWYVIIVRVPTLLLRARYTAECVVVL